MLAPMPPTHGWRQAERRRCSAVGRHSGAEPRARESEPQVTGEETGENAIAGRLLDCRASTNDWSQPADGSQSSSVNANTGDSFSASAMFLARDRPLVGVRM